MAGPSPGKAKCYVYKLDNYVYSNYITLMEATEGHYLEAPYNFPAKLLPHFS
jgi:hypothetical protein